MHRQSFKSRSSYAAKDALLFAPCPFHDCPAAVVVMRLLVVLVSHADGSRFPMGRNT